MFNISMIHIPSWFASLFSWNKNEKPNMLIFNKMKNTKGIEWLSCITDGIAFI